MILDKYPRAGKDEKSETKTQKAPISKIKTEGKTKEKQRQNRGSAVQLQVKSSAQLKLST
jgi:hypothetical protein